ncbi:MAG TPA: hypothetical protein VF473_07035 [Cyclobacteriaceae bacterium]
MTTYLFALLSVFLPGILQPITPSWRFLLLIFLMTFLLPVLNFGFLKLFGSIKSIHMYERKDRIMPFMFITILYVVITYMFYHNFQVRSVLKLMEIITAMVIVSTAITFFYKVSVHSIAVCGLVGILLPLNNAADGLLLYPTIGTLIVAGVVMSSRLQLNAHVLREVMYGAAIGFLIGFGGVILLF